MPAKVLITAKQDTCSFKRASFLGSCCIASTKNNTDEAERVLKLA